MTRSPRPSRRGIPSALRPLLRQWMRVGALLGRLTTPIGMGVLFLLVFVPIAAVLRLLGRRPGGTARAGTGGWIPRPIQPSTAADDFERPF